MLEDRTLGDLIIKLPFLDRIKGEKLVLLCDKNNSAILRYFLPEIDVLEIGCERFVSQPIYRYQVTRKICADGLPRTVSILTPYNNLAIMRTGAKILSPERYVYKGEKVQDAIKLGALEKDFCFIENPFESERLIDAHISEHVRVIFEHLFQKEFKLSRSD